jgi:hypothetical protein
MARGKQVSFPRQQTHMKNFVYAMIVLSVVCIILAVVIAKATDWGITTRP